MRTQPKTDLLSIPGQTHRQPVGANEGQKGGESSARHGQRDEMRRDNQPVHMKAGVEDGHVSVRRRRDKM